MTQMSSVGGEINFAPLKWGNVVRVVVGRPRDSQELQTF